MPPFVIPTAVEESINQNADNVGLKHLFTKDYHRSPTPFVIPEKRRNLNPIIN